MLRLAIRRSRSLAWGLAFLHGTALLLVLAVPLPLWVHAAFGVGIVASAAHAVLNHAWHGLRSSIVGLEVSEDCRVEILDRGGALHPAELLPSSVVMPWLTLLNLRQAGRRWPRSLVIVPDRVDPDPYRRLRVMLRWRCGNGMVEETPRL